MNIQNFTSMFSKRCVLLMFLVLAPITAFSEEYTFNFKDTDIKDLIKFVADATGYTIIIDPKVKAKINVISKQPVTEKEMYDLFLNVLQVHGYAAVKNGNTVRIIQNKTARTSSVPVLRGK